MNTDTELARSGPGGGPVNAIHRLGLVLSSGINHWA